MSTCSDFGLLHLLSSVSSPPITVPSANAFLPFSICLHRLMVAASRFFLPPLLSTVSNLPPPSILCPLKSHSPSRCSFQRFVDASIGNICNPYPLRRLLLLLQPHHLRRCFSLKNRRLIDMSPLPLYDPASSNPNYICH
ncbi:unnamed protein product [Lactuca virosa]|uniref:Uncharacterized protein n=1 Tax=Lactuca virosa TaxID=75947 RepID=A0AAU9PE39_9ASTR|nr:unnamed protein product [Lactuca virosa]